MKRRRIIKNKSRIPGVPVGDQVAITIGTKKKVCFNIGGRWFFRMVDPDWKAPGRPTKTRSSRRRRGMTARRPRKEKRLVDDCITSARLCYEALVALGIHPVRGYRCSHFSDHRSRE